MPKYSVKVLIESEETWVVDAANPINAELIFDEGVLMNTEKYRHKKTLSITELEK